MTIGSPQNRANSKQSLLFNFSGGEDPRQPSNRNHSPAVSIRSLNPAALQLFQAVARCHISSNGGISGVGHTIEVGNEAVRQSGQPAIESPAATSRLTKARPAVSGAMAQQGGDFGRGNQSAPQKLLQLVGCRDPNARPEPWGRPRPVPVKR